MRRSAFVVLAAFVALPLLFTGMAWAPVRELVVQNNSSQTVTIAIYQIHQVVTPHRSFHASGIAPESCVLVRVAHDRGAPNAPCRDNPTPLDVRCDVSSHYSCVVHEDKRKDVVVQIVQRGA